MVGDAHHLGETSVAILAQLAASRRIIGRVGRLIWLQTAMGMRFGGARRRRRPGSGIAAAGVFGREQRGGALPGDDCPGGAWRRPTALIVICEFLWQRRPVLGVAAAILLMKGNSEEFEFAGYMAGELAEAEVGRGRAGSFA